MSSTDPADHRTLQSLNGGTGNVDKIRDIVFGSQMRDYETRFSRLEEQLIGESADIREMNRRRFDQLETYIAGEFESVRQERGSGVNVSQKARGQSDEIRAIGEELAAMIVNHIQDLREGRIDRAALAELFTEVALRLSDQFRTAGPAA